MSFLRQSNFEMFAIEKFSSFISPIFEACKRWQSLKMFERLQKKWKVGPLQISLIIISFALGGSLTGYSAKKIMDILSVEKDWLWTIFYIVLVTILWPPAVLIVSIFFGQFKFFKSYVKRIGQKIGIVQDLKFEVSGSVPDSNSDPDGGFSNGLTTHDSPTHGSRLTTHHQHRHFRFRRWFERTKDH